MSVQYLGKANNIVTVEKLRELAGLTEGVNSITGDITWLKFNDNGKILFVSSEVIITNISWNQLNLKEVLSGKEIFIDGSKCICRSITGGNGNSESIKNSEWNRIIVNLTPDNNDSNWMGVYTICQETILNSTQHYSSRGGYNSVDYYAGMYKTDISNNYGFRPVLEVIDPIEFSDISSDFGYIEKFDGFKYTINTLRNTNFNVIEKLDGKVINNLNNQVSGTEFIFNIEKFDFLDYGNHNIEIIADDTNSIFDTTFTSKFNKIKNPIGRLALDSNLKQAVEHSLELNKEIDYQKKRLYEKFDGLDIEVNENDSLSKLVDNVQLDVRPGFPLWYRPSDVWLECETTAKDTLGAGIAYNGKIYYVAGGTNYKNNFTDIKVFDPKTNTFTSKLNKPTSTQWTGITILNDKIYCIGGMNILNTSWSEWTAKSNNECYDLITETWTTKTNMITPRANFAIGGCGNKIYCIGGNNKQYNRSNLHVSNNECYDIVMDIWYTLASMPQKKSNIYYNTYNSKIYCIGGIIQDSDYSNWESAVDTNYCYDTLTNSWETKKSKPHASWGGSPKNTLKNRYMYCIGGQAKFKSNGGSYDVGANEVYDMETDTWIAKNPITVQYSNVVNVNDKTFFSLSYDKNKSYFYVV